MKYRSTHETKALDFELGGIHYVVEVGGVCEIDAKWAPWVVSRGLCLEPYVEPPPAVVVETPEPVAVVTKSKKK